MKISPLNIVCLVTTCCFLTSPLVAEVRSYEKTYADRQLSRYDSNNDRKLTEKEVGGNWRSFVSADTDQNEVIEGEELLQLDIEYLETKGEHKLNIHYKETQEESLYLDLYYPENKGDEKLPVLIFTHGGGWGAGSKQGAARSSHKEFFTKVLEQGVCVAAVNYRLVGKTGTYVPECVSDCKDAMRYLAKQADALGIDANKFFTIGNSAGGHLSLMNALTPPTEQQGDPALADAEYTILAGLVWYGWTNLELEELFIKDKPKEFPLLPTQSRVVKQSLSEEEKNAVIHEMSPSTWLTKDSPPIFIVHGDQDQTIIDKHAYYFEQLGKERGASVDILIVKGAAHGFSKKDIEPSKEEVLDATLEFLLKHLK